MGPGKYAVNISQVCRRGLGAKFHFKLLPSSGFRLMCRNLDLFFVLVVVLQMFWYTLGYYPWRVSPANSALDL
jgi:hypothetical protein